MREADRLRPEIYVLPHEPEHFREPAASLSGRLEQQPVRRRTLRRAGLERSLALPCGPIALELPRRTPSSASRRLPHARCRTDRLYPRSLGPREQAALRLVHERPGITVEQLADALGVGMKRAWQYVERLEIHGVWREGGAPARRSKPID